MRQVMRRVVLVFAVVLLVVLLVAGQSRAVARVQCVDVDLTGLYWYMNHLTIDRHIPLGSLQIFPRQPIDGGYYRICWVE